MQPARYGRLPQMNHQRAVLSFTSTLPQPPWGLPSSFQLLVLTVFCVIIFLIYKALFLSRYLLLSLCPVSENLAEAIMNKKYKSLKAQGSGQIGVFKWLYATQKGRWGNKNEEPDQNITVISVQR